MPFEIGGCSYQNFAAAWSANQACAHVMCFLIYFLPVKANKLKNNIGT
jgi:hypothetical protein